MFINLDVLLPLLIIQEIRYTVHNRMQIVENSNILQKDKRQNEF